MEEHRPSVHISSGHVGHAPSIDCWCEPSTIIWFVNPHGVLIRVVEHNDCSNRHHREELAFRDHLINEEYTNEPDAGWITRVLNSLDHPPKILPPPPPPEN